MSTQEEILKKAADTLNQGGVVGLPTETVYGLAARIDNPQAVERIFTIKERPFFDPLIVHVSSVAQAQQVTSQWEEVPQALAKAFWPGPLTMILPRSPRINTMITSGLDSVGIRMPRHPLALQLIEQVGVPLAAPSANKFGKTSPTTAAHVHSEFKTEQVYVVDGGDCEIGIESTVLLIRQREDKAVLSVLRRGSILQSEIEAALVQTSLPFEFLDQVDKKESPGHMKHHYMPPVPLIVCLDLSRSVESVLTEVDTKLSQLPNQIEGVSIMKPPGRLQRPEVFDINTDPVLATREFYAKLRELAHRGPDCLIFYRETYHYGERWESLFDRMNKAASLIL
jgi:L-threonylcarbamoyladenylate synthase